MEEGGLCQSPDSSPGERVMGPFSSIGRDIGFLHTIEREIQRFPPAAVSLVLAGETYEPNIMEEGDIHSLQNDPRPFSKVKESRKGRKFQEQCHATELSMSGRGGTQQQTSAFGLGAGIGTGGDASPLLAAAGLSVQLRGERRHGERLHSGGGGGSGGSVTSSLADHLDSEILGEVDNFSWDLHSTHGSDRPMGLLAVAKRTFLEASHTQPQSIPNERSESECYTEDQKFYRHMVHMVKRSRGTDLAVPEPLKQLQSGSEEFVTGLNVELYIPQEGAAEAEMRPRPGAAVFKAGVLQSPVEGQVFFIQNREAEGEQVQSRTLAKKDSWPELSPGGDGGEESPGPILAPVQSPLGSLAPLRGFVDAPVSAPCNLQNTNGRSAVEPKAPAHTITMLGSCKKSLFQSVDEEEEASLNQLTPNGAEKEDCSNESPRGTGGLLKNLHMDVSALGASFDNEVSEGSNAMKEWQVSDHLDPEPHSTVSPSLENIMDVLPPVPGTPKFAVSRAMVESTWKEQTNDWSGQEKDQSKGSLAEEKSQGSAKRERCKSCPSGSEASEKKAALVGSGALETKMRIEHRLVNLNERDPSCKENFEAEGKQMPWEKHAGDSLEEITKAHHTLLEQAKIHLLQEKQTRIQQLQEELQQEEEQEIQMLHQQKKDALQSLKAELEAARQKEEERLRKELEDELLKLQTQIHSEAEAEKARIRLAQEAALQKLREELESFQKSEEDELKVQKQLSLERVKKEAEAVEQAEQMELEQEIKRTFNELKKRLAKENEMAMQELKEQFAEEIQLQKSAAKEEHEKVVSALQMQIAEAHKREEAELQKQLESSEQNVQQKRNQVAEYERELSDLLKEKRQEVERNHARQLEKMQEAHRETIAEIQAQNEDEERKKRTELLATLQSEQERLELNHKAELDALQKKQAEQLKELHKSHSDQEQKVQSMKSELELQAKDMEARLSQLHAQEENLRKKRQQVLEQEKELEQERNEAALAAQRRLEESQKEQEDLAETTRQLRGDLAELQDQKSELESQVEMLQLQSQQLQKRVSELETAIESRQELLNKVEVGSSKTSPEKKEEALRVEDLKESAQAPSPGEMSTSKGNEERSVLLEQVQRTVFAEGATLKTAKEFLVRNTRSMHRRQTALRAAKQHWSFDPQKAPGTAQDFGRFQRLDGVRKSLETEEKTLDEMNSTMQKGKGLVKQTEEVLSQLMSSLEELSDEDTLKGMACKKVVTFDVTDSENTSGVMNTDEPLRKVADMKPDHQFLPFDEIQYLANSLQRLTSDLMVVLQHLSSFCNQPLPLFTSTQGPASTLPRDRVPLATCNPLADSHSATPSAPNTLPQWVWAGSGPSPSAPAGQSVDAMLMEKWRKYFPGSLCPVEVLDLWTARWATYHLVSKSACSSAVGRRSRTSRA
ncbi:centrosomal protein of 164 kDa isoform X3 [Lacerta agilis]|uniref:centrosomal protein of 164 kDa isoform X3 n=1 Tax=Lacerta agilis TaxID=80427 RepID=UPI00141948B7|nr:centrosomal protein of 164 kDa isoform X3 [Lacerta agilis]